MRYVYTILFFLSGITAYSQGEANNWYFGDRAGINFGTTPPTALTDGRLSTLEGCTTISDATGSLLFYTDGSIIYTRNHDIMQNGTGLKGDESSTSSALIVPQPNTPNIYIVFTVDEPHHDNADGNPATSDGDGVNDGLQYSIVDMTLDGGNGAVVQGQKNIPLVTYDTTDQLESLYKCSEKITAVKSDDCDSFWVITHFSDTYYAFKVDDTGVNPTPTTSQIGVTVPVSGYRRNALGYLKASPEGDKLALAHYGFATIAATDGPGKVLLYDFDNATGIVSNELELYNGDGPYGVEFSQSGQRLYTSIGSGIDGEGDGFMLQFDLSLPDAQIAASGTRIRNENGQELSNFSAGALQLGPDGKIYRALLDFNNGFGDYLGIIDNPEALAPNVNYTERGLLVNVDGTRQSYLGLPPFIQSIFAQTIDIINNGDANNVNINFCEGETYRLSYQDIPGATYTWFIDNVQISTTTNFLDITTTANYRLEVDLNDGSCPLIGVANATFFEVPSVSNTPADETICNPNLNGVVDLDLSVYDNIIIGTQDPTQFQVRYFRSIADADADNNPLPVNFTTENNPQTIAVRIENIDNTDCYNTTSFQVEIFDAATTTTVEPIIICDNDDDGDDTNGMVNFDLTTLNSAIYGSQDPLEFTITYHNTLIGAETNTDLIADPTNAVLSNTTPTIYARIENNTNTDCFDTLDIAVAINLLPEANTSTLVQCDDPATPSDTSLFNLNEAFDQITGGVSDRSILFFEDQASAEAGTPEITNTNSYQNTQPNQQLYVRVNNNITDCFRITTLNLQVSTTSANDVDLLACDDDDVEDGFRIFDLTQADNDILPIGSTNLSVTYYETQDNAFSEQNPITTYTNTTFYTQGQDIIYARVEDNSNQCFGINEVSLFLNRQPDIEEQAGVFICQNETTDINSGLQQPGNDPNDFDYLWSTGETTESITISQAGTYTVLVTSRITNCSKERTVTVTTSGPAILLDPIITDGESRNTVTVVIEEASVGDYEYAIAFNGSSIRTYQDSNIFVDVPPGFHIVYVRDKNGCGEVTQNISVIGFPDFFTPNGDGTNETWGVTGVSADAIANSLVYIFDRNGKLLKQIRPGGSGWDGTYNGRLLPSSQYWYRVQLDDGRIISGSFALIR
ncbi:T9SS type B sorting domain-containing protein [Aquimarina sp. MMG016]|uniref:T9SS type B sorting domain-containing protein n=1 Tax=Aquimarina sp. MMG016 TaxID=2822690 RepID=UPI001B39FE14|nr:T9SS type B sorting domain-containing protein [Aquimarina sp. MMG016]MBQ4820259.1 T9SS type B sorting domain-containing protein [Aquimarina sp. MMG016]